jgi:hypothetical protein
MTQQTFQWRVSPTEQQINDWDKEATYRAIAVLGNALGEAAFRRRIAAIREVDESQITPVKNWNFNTLRRTLVDLKRDIGANHMLDLLKDEIQQGQLAAKQYLSESRGETRPCSTVLLAPNLTGKEFVGQFPSVFYGNYHDVHPEHYAFGSEPAVGDAIPDHFTVEFVGGGIHYVKILMLDSSKAVVDIESPYHLVALAVTQDGTEISYITHQHVDTREGLEMRLHVEFPAAFTNEMVSRHQEHFAIEFNNAVMKME